MILNIISSFFASLIITGISYMDIEEKSMMIFVKNFVASFIVIFLSSIFLTSFSTNDILKMPVDSTIL